MRFKVYSFSIIFLTIFSFPSSMVHAEAVPWATESYTAYADPQFLNENDYDEQISSTSNVTANDTDTVYSSYWNETFTNNAWSTITSSTMTVYAEQLSWPSSLQSGGIAQASFSGTFNAPETYFLFDYDYTEPAQYAGLSFSWLTVNNLDTSTVLFDQHLDPSY